MTPRADLEITSAIIRLFNNSEATFGEPFDLTVVVVGDEGTAILKGLRMDRARLSMAHTHAILDRLRERGFHTAIWHRYKAGARREVRVVL